MGDFGEIWQGGYGKNGVKMQEFKKKAGNLYAHVKVSGLGWKAEMKPWD